MVGHHEAAHAVLRAGGAEHQEVVVADRRAGLRVAVIDLASGHGLRDRHLALELRRSPGRARRSSMLSVSTKTWPSQKATPRLATWPKSQKTATSLGDQRHLTSPVVAFIAGEVRRVLRSLRLSTPGDVIDRCCSSARTDLRHYRFTIQHLFDAGVSRDVVDLYARLSEEAGWLDGGSTHRPTAVLLALTSHGSDLCQGDDECEQGDPVGRPVHDTPKGWREPALEGPEDGFRLLDRSALELELLRRGVGALRLTLAAREAEVTELLASSAEAETLRREVAELRNRIGQLSERDAKLQVRLRQLGLEKEAALQGRESVCASSKRCGKPSNSKRNSSDSCGQPSGRARKRAARRPGSGRSSTGSRAARKSSARCWSTPTTNSYAATKSCDRP